MSSAVGSVIGSQRSVGRWGDIPARFGNPPTLRVLARFGAPLAVVMLTGGLSTFEFWLVTVLHLGALFIFAAPMVVPLLMIPSALLRALLVKVLPRFEEPITSVLGTAPWLLACGFLFLTHDLPIDDRVRLPTSSAHFGVFLVVSAAGLVSWGLLTWADRRECALRPAVWPMTGRHSAEPPDEFWTTEPVTAWRMWNWDGVTLRGMRVAWDTPELAAICATCEEPPGWGHSCGIYALSSPDAIRRFREGASVVVGKVELSGLVIEHELGYRASHARIIELEVGSHRVARALMDKYPDLSVRVEDESRRLI